MSVTPKSRKRKKLKVINLLGAPGMGKSALRSGAFWLFKAHNVSIEEVSEYAKYLVLSGRTWQLKQEQLYLLSKQHHKQVIVQRSGYEYAITDSPLALCSFYAPKSYYKSFIPLVAEASERYENINFFVTRDLSGAADFEDRGRQHNRQQSMEVELRMRDFLAKQNVQYTDLLLQPQENGPDLVSPWRLMDAVMPGKAVLPDFSTLTKRN